MRISQFLLKNHHIRPSGTDSIKSIHCGKLIIIILSYGEAICTKVLVRLNAKRPRGRIGL
jgi:hypothetical protein